MGDATQGPVDLHEFCSSLKDQQLEDTSVQLSDILETHKNKCWLEQMYVPSQNKHRHAVIAISGFLSESADLKNHAWAQLTNFCRVRNIPLFVVRWEAKNDEDIY